MQGNKSSIEFYKLFIVSIWNRLISPILGWNEATQTRSRRTKSFTPSWSGKETNQANHTRHKLCHWEDIRYQGKAYLLGILCILLSFELLIFCSNLTDKMRTFKFSFESKKRDLNINRGAKSPTKYKALRFYLVVPSIKLSLGFGKIYLEKRSMAVRRPIQRVWRHPACQNLRAKFKIIGQIVKKERKIGRKETDQGQGATEEGKERAWRKEKTAPRRAQAKVRVEPETRFQF